MSNADRRATPRYSIEPGSFAFYALGSGAIADLSLQGVFIAARDNAPDSGTKLDLELRLKDETIAVSGIVRRVHPGRGFGVQFSEIPADTRQRLDDYIRSHFAKSG